MKAKIWNISGWINHTDADYIKSVMNDILSKATFNVLNYSENRFNPYGFTGLWLLAESHFAVHTFPEHDSSYIELSSCNELKHTIFEKLLLERFELIQRGDIKNP